MTEKIIIEIETQDNTQAVANGIVSDFKQVEEQSKRTGAASESAAKTAKMSWTEFQSMYTTVLSVIRTGKEVWDEVVGKTLELSNNVRQMRDVTGQTAEESSRLIQVLDDYKISVSDAEKATKKLATEGLSFNIETIAKLSDEYLKLNEGQERTNFLYENFGRAGENFAEIMLQGSDAILAANDAISKNLILTDKQLKQAREYEKNLDNLNDSVLAYKVTIGNELIPAANDLITVETRVIELMEEGLNPYEARRKAVLELSEANRIAALSVEEMDRRQKDDIVTTQQHTSAIQEDEDALNNLSASNERYLSAIGDISREIEGYNEKTKSLKDEHSALLEEKQKLLDQGWWEESDAIQDVNRKLAENEGKQKSNAEAHDQATKERMLDLLEEQLAVDGLDKRETEFLLQQGLKWGIYSQDAVDEMMAVQDEVDDLINKYDSIPGLVTTNIVANYISNYQGEVRTPSGASRRAGGGSVSGGKMYEVTEMGMPELLNMSGRQYLMMPPEKNGNVIPVGGGGTGEGATRGGGVVVNVNYSPMLSLGTDSEIKSRLIPIIIQGVQEAKVQGKIQ